MFGMVILDVAIGLILFYLLFSLIGSAVAESIELLLKARARTLEEGIRSVLFDKDGTGMAAQFYSHPLIKGLRREAHEVPLPFKLFRALGVGLEKLKELLKTGKAARVDISRFQLPSYIPSELFVTALMDILVRGNPQELKAVTSAGSPDLNKVKDALAKLTGVDGKQELANALMALLPIGSSQLSAFEARVETWFNGAMDRVSGWYKQRTQWVLFLIGLVAAGIMNADSIRIAQVLAKDRAVRESVVAMAQQSVSAGLPAAPGASTPDAFAKQLQERLDRVSESVSNVKGLGLPLGWKEDPLTVTAKPGQESSPRWLLFLLKGLGLLATAVAMALGAPFWFDLLNKFMVIRSTVKPQEKSKKEGSKDG